MSAINDFLLRHQIRMVDNPCVSPDFCLDWPTLVESIRTHGPTVIYDQAAFTTAEGTWTLVGGPQGDCAWQLHGTADGADLELRQTLPNGSHIYPATWVNLLRLKNAILAHDPASTIFPSTGGGLERTSLGIGARFTTLHWPAVEWAMTQLNISLVANQNSIPRELVYNVDAMLDGSLQSVRFPFIGADVPEGHQGQSVEGMSHGAVLSKLKTGFHHRRIAWGFNADHQPIGGAFDQREDDLVTGCVLASSITFDLSPELLTTPACADPATWVAAHVDPALRFKVRDRVSTIGIPLNDQRLDALLAQVYPAMEKMVLRDRKYREARERLFTAAAGRAYIRELSIDELPGLTEPDTLAIMLALCQALDMTIHYVAPAFGFQKNFPFADQAELKRRISAAWDVCKQFGVSIGFHSGSGKSAENYQLCGQITGGALEIKTSGRYTYEMGVALAASSNSADQTLWHDWYAFTRTLATSGAFSDVAVERDFARSFIIHALKQDGKATDVFTSPATCAQALAALTPSPDHMFWFEYNFLFVLAADGAAVKATLGDHGPKGYTQRARFYAISDEGQLRYAQGVAGYILFLAETTGIAPSERVAAARKRLGTYTRYQDVIQDISPVG